MSIAHYSDFLDIINRINSYCGDGDPVLREYIDKLVNYLDNVLIVPRNNVNIIFEEKDLPRSSSITAKIIGPELSVDTFYKLKEIPNEMKEYFKKELEANLLLKFQDVKTRMF